MKRHPITIMKVNMAGEGGGRGWMGRWMSGWMGG